jgi:hypothetical protein
MTTPETIKALEVKKKVNAIWSFIIFIQDKH